LDDAAALPSLLRIRVYDARGRLVRRLEDARLAGPTGELLWNGRDDAGNRVRVGIYVVLFEAVNARGGTALVEKKPVVVGRVLN
jgi:flagellar hook assembly protein FlgD